jgi:hypothetical protein
MLGELLDGVGVGDPALKKPGQVGAPEAPLRPHLVHHLAYVLGDVEVRERLGGVAGMAGTFT